MPQKSDWVRNEPFGGDLGFLQSTQTNRQHPPGKSSPSSTQSSSLSSVPLVNLASTRSRLFKARLTLNDENLANALLSDFEDEVEKYRIELTSIPVHNVEQLARRKLAWLARSELELKRLTQLRDARLNETKSDIKTIIDERHTKLQMFHRLHSAAVKDIEDYYDGATLELRAILMDRARTLKPAYGAVSNSIYSPHIIWARLIHSIFKRPLSSEVAQLIQSRYSQKTWANEQQRPIIRVLRIRGIRNKLPAGEYVLLASKWTSLGGESRLWTVSPPRERPVNSATSKVGRGSALLQFFGDSASSLPFATWPCPLHHPQGYAAAALEAAMDTIRVTCDERPKNAAEVLIHYLSPNDNATSWSQEVTSACEVCTGWASASQPFTHSGDPRAVDMFVDHTFWGEFPSPNDVQPQEVLMFELVSLTKASCLRNGSPGKLQHRLYKPHVVGWGAIPLVDARNQAINGKFRIPLLRGPHRPAVQRTFESIHKSLCEDMENWMGNIYIEVSPMARLHALTGQSEFSAMMKRTNMKLGLNPYQRTDGETQISSHLREPKVHRETSVKARDEIELFKLLDSLFYKRPSNGPLPQDLAIAPREDRAKMRWDLVRESIAEKKRLTKQLHKRLHLVRLAWGAKQRLFGYSIHSHYGLGERWYLFLLYITGAFRFEFLRGPFRLMLGVFFFVLSLIINVYMHGVMLYFGLLVARIPRVLSFEWYGLDIYFNPADATPLTELMLCFFNICLMWCLAALVILTAFSIKQSFGSVTTVVSRFVYTFLFATFALPWVDVVFDQLLTTGTSDALRLIRYFDRESISPAWSVLSLFILLTLSSIALTIMIFVFTFTIYRNGMLRDAYWRAVMAKDDKAFLPPDMEISQAELKYAIRSAGRWRGKNGERRKVLVKPNIDANTRNMIEGRDEYYVLIVELKSCRNLEEWERFGRVEVYREFQVMHDGTILENLVTRMPQKRGLKKLETVLKRLKEATKREVTEEGLEERVGRVPTKQQKTD